MRKLSLIPLVVLVLALSVTAQADVLLEDGFETNFDKWTDGGTTDWDRATSQKHTGSYSAHCGSRDNDLISDNMNTSSSSSITIVLWYRDDDIDDKDNVYLKLYDGSSYDNKFELGNSTEDTWHQYEVTINNSGADAEYFHSTFRIKFEGSSIDRGENLWIDDVTVTVSGEVDNPPTVSITSPSPGATVSGTVDVTADASDDNGVDKVEFYIDDVLKSTDTTSPYEYSWDTTVYADGSHGIKAKAYDTIGQTATDSITVTVDNVPAAGADPISSSSIMFQAFYWDCFNESGKGNWWDYIAARATGLKSAGFTHFWFPVPCKGNSGNSGMGYDVFDNYDLGEYNQKGTIETAFGSKQELIAAAAATGNVLLDVVPNHMMGAPATCVDSGDGKTYWQRYTYPHGTFEKNCSHYHPGYPDDCDLCNGLDYLMGEDVCHHSAYMFNGQKTWVNWLKTTVGNISGSRLDAVKHFDWDMSKEFGTLGSCVGEYWDSKNNILNWISYTGNYAFDFPLYYSMQGSASALNGAGLCSTKGVSFVANHDADGISQKHRAYGYIMYIPPVPCVFWPHWFDGTLQPSIQRAMDARNTYDFNGTFTVCSTTNFIIFENNAPVFGCFNSASSTGSETITVGPNITYTAVAWGPGNQPADITSDGDGNLTLTAPGQGYTYWYGGAGGGSISGCGGGEFASAYSSVAIPGTHNGWNPAGDPMTLIADWTWEGAITFSSGSEEYKFAMNGGWTVNRGLGNSSGPNLPQTVTNLTQDGGNIPINVPNGTVVFTYHENTESSTAAQQ